MPNRNAEGEALPDRRQRAPWHLWMVGLFFTLLYAASAYDQVRTLGQGADYLRLGHYKVTQIAYFTDAPISLNILWSIGVWGILAAAILLLLRTRWATPVAYIALAAQVLLDIVTFGFMDRWQLFGPWLSLYDLAMLLLTAAFVLYCRAMSARGVLR
jgi:uncharacterized membrane protein